MAGTQIPGLGIAAIATYQPPWSLSNDWFGGNIARKFVQQTGIVSRPISDEDEVAMAIRAAINLERDTHCHWRDCAGVIFCSPSFVPLDVAEKYFDPQRVRQEHLPTAARKFAERLGITHRPVHALNWFCSGYAKALAIATQAADPAFQLKKNQFLLVVNASRISRITDFGCRQTGPLFGDLSTISLLARQDSTRYPTRFNILYAAAQKLATDAAYFDFHLRQNVLAPTVDGGKSVDPERLVFSMNGMGVADTAPRAMSSAVTGALQATGIAAEEVQHVVPHQAGTGIVRLAAMKFEAAGMRAEVINGMTAEVGNVSSCSIPYALKKTWNRLDGTIACPTAAVGSPGQAEMSHGCIILQAVPGSADVARVA